MSQQKVEKYKEYKKNKKEILKKEKRKKMAAKIAGWAVVVAVCGVIVAAIGTKAYTGYQNYKAKLPVYTSESYILTDMSGILSETEEDQSAE